MYRNTRLLRSSLLALLSLSVGQWSSFITAISPAEPSEKRSLLPPVANVFSQGPGRVPAAADPATAFISSRQITGETDSSGENSEGMVGQPAEPEREEAATQQVRTDNAGSARPQVLQRYTTLQSLLPPALRRTAGSRPGQEKKEAQILYKNSIRECMSSAAFDRDRFCEETGSLVECQHVLRAVELANSFSRLRIRSVSFVVKTGGGLIRVELPVFDDASLKILTLLYYYLTEKCRYEAKVMPFVLTCLEDAVDTNPEAAQIWGWRSQASGELRASAAVPADRLMGLYLLDALLVGILVQVGSMSRASPTLARVVNFACRWNRFCRPVMREVLLKIVPAGLPRTMESAQWLSPDLIKTIKKLLEGLLSGGLRRLQNKIALALSTWLSESVRTMR